MNFYEFPFFYFHLFWEIMSKLSIRKGYTIFKAESEAYIGTGTKNDSVNEEVIVEFVHLLIVKKNIVIKKNGPIT